MEIAMSDPVALSSQETQEKTIEAVSSARPSLFGELRIAGERSWASPYLTVGFRWPTWRACCN
jgi:hypothetical protein